MGADRRRVVGWVGAAIRKEPGSFFAVARSKTAGVPGLLAFCLDSQVRVTEEIAKGKK
jgi:hypothetical protein